MSDFVKYQLDDGQELFVETPPPPSGTESEAAQIATHSFSESLEAVKSAALAIRQKFANLAADETEVTFALQTVGELGVFAIAKVGAEANFRVTMRWKKTNPQQWRDVD